MSTVVLETTVSEIAAVQDVDLQQQQQPVLAAAPEAEAKEEKVEEMVLPSLAQLLLGYLASPTLKIRIPLSTVLQLQSLMQSQGAWFDGMERGFAKIVADGKIDSKDIPHFLEMIREAHQLMKSLKLPNQDELISFAMQLMIHYLVDSGRISLDDPEGTKQLLSALLESSLALLHVQSKGCRCW